MTEEQIENAVCRKIDSLDRRFMNQSGHGFTMTQEEYDAEIKAINTWSENEYRFVERA